MGNNSHISHLTPLFAPFLFTNRTTPPTTTTTISPPHYIQIKILAHWTPPNAVRRGSITTKPASENVQIEADTMLRHHLAKQHGANLQLTERQRGRGGRQNNASSDQEDDDALQLDVERQTGGPDVAQNNDSDDADEVQAAEQQQQQQRGGGGRGRFNQGGIYAPLQLPVAAGPEGRLDIQEGNYAHLIRHCVQQLTQRLKTRVTDAWRSLSPGRQWWIRTWIVVISILFIILPVLQILHTIARILAHPHTHPHTHHPYQYHHHFSGDNPLPVAAHHVNTAGTTIAHGTDSVPPHNTCQTQSKLPPLSHGGDDDDQLTNDAGGSTYHQWEQTMMFDHCEVCRVTGAPWSSTRDRAGGDGGLEREACDLYAVLGLDTPLSLSSPTRQQHHHHHLHDYDYDHHDGDRRQQQYYSEWQINAAAERQLAWLQRRERQQSRHHHGGLGQMGYAAASGLGGLGGGGGRGGAEEEEDDRNFHDLMAAVYKAKYILADPRLRDVYDGAILKTHQYGQNTEQGE